MQTPALRSLDLPGIPPLPKKRGRPATGQALSDAARKAKSRSSLGLVVLSVEIPVQLLSDFNEFLKFKNKTKNEVISSLLKNQLLRRR